MNRFIGMIGAVALLAACAGSEGDREVTPPAQPTAGGRAMPSEIDLESTTETPAVAAVPGVGYFSASGQFLISPDKSRPVVTLNVMGDQTKSGETIAMSLVLAAAQTKALMAGQAVAVDGASSLNLASAGRQDPRPIQRLRLERRGNGVSVLTVELGGQVAMLKPDTARAAIQKVVVKGQIWAACAAPLPDQGDSAVVFDPSFRTDFCRDALRSYELDKLDE